MLPLLSIFTVTLVDFGVLDNPSMENGNLVTTLQGWASHDPFEEEPKCFNHGVMCFHVCLASGYPLLKVP